MSDRARELGQAEKYLDEAPPTTTPLVGEGVGMGAEPADHDAPARSGPERMSAWIAAGPMAVLAAWVALVFTPAAFRLQALYASVALLSVVAFVVSFHLSAYSEARAQRARHAAAESKTPVLRPATAGQEATARVAGMPLPQDQGAAMDQSDTRFRLVVEAAPNAMIMIDSRGNIQLLNSQAERLFGYERSELLGKSIEVLLPVNLRSMHLAVRNAYFRAPEARRMGAGRDLFGLRRDGSEVPIEIGLNPVVVAGGTLVLASIIDITERKRAEQALRVSEERFRLVVEDAPNAMVMVDEAGRIALLNAAAERLFGYARSELIGKPAETVLPGQFGASTATGAADLLKAHQAGPISAGRDLYGLRRDGSEVPIEIGLNPIHSTEGAFILASIIDMTERKRAQEELAAALLEKTVLLNEIHHRVKNNLQVITSLLNLQAGRARDPALQALVAESRDRVQAMALIHQLLFERRDWSRVQLAPYLGRLSDLLTSTYGARQGRIELRVEADDVDIDVQRAVPCGLLVNELVTNAFKHAFPGGQGGRVSIVLRREPDGHAVLRVSDTGVGLPEHIDLNRVESLGMQLVPLLAEQVRATLHIDKGPGACFELRFPLDTVDSST